MIQKCVPLEDLLRTKPGVKSTQVISVRQVDITDLIVASLDETSKGELQV